MTRADALVEPGDLIELLAFCHGKKCTDGGYLDGKHRENLYAEAAKPGLDCA